MPHETAILLAIRVVAAGIDGDLDGTAGAGWRSDLYSVLTGLAMSEATDVKADMLLERLAAAMPGAELDYERIGEQHRFTIGYDGCWHAVPLSDSWFTAQTDESLTQAARTIAHRLRATVDLYECA